MRFAKNTSTVLIQIMIAVSMCISAAASVGLAVTPNDAFDAAKTVGGLNTAELLALVCIASLALSFYLVRTLIAMAKKPCVYLEKQVDK